jgi:uncharacterized protein (UPF0332 family)
MNREERLNLARENMEEAKLLYGEKIGTKVVFTKLYHALMYCLFALFDVRISGNLTHADVIERFEMEYVSRGVFDKELLKVIRHAYDLTHECDCDHMPVPSDLEIDEAARAAARFIAETHRFLNKEVSKHESSAV